MLKVGAYNVTVEEDSKQTKKRKKLGDRFKLEVEQEDGRHEKYVLATENSLDRDDWVKMLMSQEDKNGLRASQMAASVHFGDDDEDVSHPKLLEQVPKVELEVYALPVRNFLFGADTVTCDLYCPGTKTLKMLRCTATDVLG